VSLVREGFERLTPSEPADFFDDLWDGIDVRERTVSRRWRAAAIVSATVALAAVSAAGVLAFERGGAGALTTYDQTMSCPMALKGGVPIFKLQAAAKHSFYNNGQTFTQAGNAFIEDTNGQGFGGVGAAPHGYGFPNPELCRSAARVPLAPSGLALEGVYRQGQFGLGGDFGVTCLVGNRVTIRVQAVIGRNDTPVSGRIAVRTGKKARPVAYVRWTPTRVDVYLSPDCHDTF
jgi:hypothetical protein